MCGLRQLFRLSGGVPLYELEIGDVCTSLAVTMLLSGPVAAVIMREKSSLGMPKLKFEANVIKDHFNFPTKGARNLYLALFGKMMINIAVTAFSVYQLFYLTSGMGVDKDTAGNYISAMGVATMVTAIIFAPISGPISDKIGARKWVVAFSALLTAIGTIIPFIYQQPVSMIWYGVVAGIGAGILFSVDQALNLEVLPNPASGSRRTTIWNGVATPTVCSHGLTTMRPRSILILLALTSITQTRST